MTTLREPVLEPSGTRHEFALDAARDSAGVARPQQVHGAAVARESECRDPEARPEADAVVSTTPGVTVGVVSADCVPILLASRDGVGVAAVHAGWRGLAEGVVAAGVAALAEATGAAPDRFLAGIGPHIGSCCYEVDAPVLEQLAVRHGEALDSAAHAVRRGHAMLDLGILATAALVRAGVPVEGVGRGAAACTSCDPRHFPSYRRDGPSAGRLLHVIALPAGPR